MKKIATLSSSANPEDICLAIKQTLAAVNDEAYKTRIRQFVEEFYCMEQQLKPVVRFLTRI